MNNKNCAFTIVAKNYIGLARILEESIRTYNNNTDFYIIVADELKSVNNFDIPENVLVAKDILKFEDSQWYEMAFKYSLTEFCTSIKPKSIEYFLNKGYERVMYLDPDTFFFNNIKIIFDMLDNYSVVLSPHLLHIPKNEITDLPETTFLNCGTYNLGFIAVKNTFKVHEVMKWWNNRLVKYAFIDLDNGLFTDQIWINFVPGFLGQNECLISRHQGLDVAPWNYSEREILVSDNIYQVRERNTENSSDPLIFAHFSGYDYKSLTKGDIIQKTRENLRDYEDVNKIIGIYTNAFKQGKAMFNSYIANEYSYSCFSDGTPVTHMIRRIFRSWIEDGNYVDNPFLVSDKFYQLLRTNKFLLKSNANDGQNIDKITRKNLSGVDKYEKVLISFAKIAHSVLGNKKYTFLMKFMRSFSRPESQLKLMNKN